MKNVSHSPVTEMLSGKNKIWLMVGLALMSAADLSACIVLWIFGAASSYWFIPFAMAVVDLLYLIGVALSNQRFKYAQSLFIVYVMITAALMIIWISQASTQRAVLYANVTATAWSLLHGVGIAAAIASYVYSARIIRVMRTVQFALAVAFSAVALLGCVAFYVITIFSEGYFGQGNGVLPLVYSYVGDDECKVTDVVFGKGGKVVIPYEFNGRKVTAVESKVFSYANVKSVTLNCDSNIALCEDAVGARSINSNITIYADKKAVDTIKQKLYGEEYYAARHALGNNVRPIVGKDEVYITFDYDRDSYMEAKNKIIPTWYGKKGDTFRLSDIEGLDYVERSDVNSDDDLYYCYNNAVYQGDGYIMSELKSDGKAINGIAIDKSRNNVRVRFQRVCKVFVSDGNDSMYDAAEYFDFTTANGVVRDYKLTVADKADELLKPFDRGEAFTRTMYYTAFDSSAQRKFTSLSELLNVGYSEVTIAPYWELVQPKITLSAVTDAADIVYGDEFELTATAEHPLAGVQIEYEWYDDVQRIGYEQTLQKRAMTAGEVTFTAIAKVSAPEVTSCTSGNAAQIKVNVNKRPLTVTWRMEGGGDVYDGESRNIIPTAENTVDGESVFLMGYIVMHAGTYTDKATLGSVVAEKYYIAEGESYTYTIKPCPVPLAWDDKTEFEYDGEPHTPTAHAVDLSGYDIPVSYIGAQTNAGENYTATAVLLNSDYVIDDASQKTKDFKITPKAVNVVWGNSELTYNGRLQAPTATAVGAKNENVDLVVTGGQVNANLIGGNKVNTYTAVATTSNGNYTLTGSSKEFTIAPFEIRISWTNTTLTYNGKAQKPTATALGVNGLMTANITAETDVGEYPKTAVFNDNYAIVEGATQMFTISPMEVRAEWTNTALTYNGKAQKPTATAKGVDGVDLSLTVTTPVDVKIGDGTATAAFAVEYPNYSLINTTVAFSVARKTLTVTVQDVTMEYGHAPDYNVVVDGIVDGDEVDIAVVITLYTPDEHGNIPVGEYIIDAVIGDIHDVEYYTINVVRKGKLTVTAPTQSAEE